MRDPDTGQSISFERYGEIVQVRRNPDIGFDDTAVEIIPAPKDKSMLAMQEMAYELLIQQNKTI